MFTHESLCRLLFRLKHDESLPLAINLEQLCVDDRTMLRHVVEDCFLGDLLGKGRNVYHLCWSAAMSVVLDYVAVEPVKARV